VVDVSWLFGLLTSGVVSQFTEPLLEAHRQRLEAANDAERLAAEREIARLEVARDIAVAEQADRWSATRLGRLLIVIPFGIWWASVFVVSIVNPLFGWSLTIDDIPARFWEISVILIPAIILGDAGALAVRRFGRR
jgi:hypothetical protein